MSLYSLLLYMAIGTAAVVIFLAGAFLIERGSGVKMKVLAALVLLTAGLSYGAVYWFEVSHGTSTGTAVGASIAFGSVVFIAVVFGARKLAELPSDISFDRKYRRHARWRMRAVEHDPEGYEAYSAEVSRQFDDGTYDTESARSVRDRLEAQVQVSPGVTGS